MYINNATLENLLPGKEYVYRIVNGEYVSQTYSFKTSASDEFNFLFASDAQIGASYDVSTDAENWENSLNNALAMFPNTTLLIHAGDQVDVPDNEEQYAGYLQPAALSSLASATVVGNHDEYKGNYGEHFNNPNTTTDGEVYGYTYSGCDYWFTYNNTLFLCLNTNDTDNAEHKEFMEKAIAANPDVDWKVVVMHHSIYSAAYHSLEEDVIQRREEFPPIFTEQDIDVVLMGHDHIYVRTYMMNGSEPDTSNGVESSVMNPTGMLYLTANCASGSKYNDLITSVKYDYAAVKSQERTPAITNVEVTKTMFKITTYCTDDMSVLDEFEIKKCSHGALEYLASKDAACTEAGNIECWYCSDCDTFFSDAGTTVITTGMIPATGHTESAPEKDETVPDAAVTKCETCGELLYVKVEDAYFTRHKVEDYKGGSEEAWTYPSREGKVFAGWYDDDYGREYYDQLYNGSGGSGCCSQRYA